MPTPTLDKIKAIIAAVNEHAAIYAAVKPPATPETYLELIKAGMNKGLTDKIADIVTDE